MATYFILVHTKRYFMTINQLRILGSICLIVGYFFILYVSVYWGCWIRLTGNLVMMPFAVRMRIWDIVAVQSFFSAIDASKIIQLLL